MEDPYVGTANSAGVYLDQYAVRVRPGGGYFLYDDLVFLKVNSRFHKSAPLFLGFLDKHDLYVKFPPLLSQLKSFTAVGETEPVGYHFCEGQSPIFHTINRQTPIIMGIVIT
jgi:hypothetical protein